MGTSLAKTKPDKELTDGNETELSRVARFFLAQHTKTVKIYQNDHK
jgi:hypothetical protein